MKKPGANLIVYGVLTTALLIITACGSQPSPQPPATDQLLLSGTPGGNFDSAESAQAPEPAPADTVLETETDSLSLSRPGIEWNEQSIEAAILQVQEAIRSSIDTGRYRLSGGNEEIVFTGIGNHGPLSYRDLDGNSYTGVYSISGNTLTLTIQGLGRFSYTLTGRTSFSSQGEVWTRVGP